MRRWGVCGLAAVLAVYLAAPGAWAAEKAGKVVKLAEGVFAWDSPGANVNNGVIVGSRGVFVYNCDLDKTYKHLTALIQKEGKGKTVRFLGNGHAAGDDIGCNGQFEDMGATIVGSEAMYQDLAEKGPKRYKARLEKAGGRLVYPHMSFKDRAVFDLGSHQVHMILMGKGHTVGDTVAYLPKEKVLFSTDLLFVENHPTITDGDTANWQKILATLRAWEVEALVPGHGPVVQGRENVRKAIDALDAYFTDVRGQVKAMMAQGKKLAEIQKGVDTKKYASWGRKNVLPASIKHIYAELGGKN